MVFSFDRFWLRAMLPLFLLCAVQVPSAHAIEIIGDDDREAVKDTNDPRLTGLVRIEAWFKDHTRRCSGVLTSAKNVVLTAAHCATNYPSSVAADSVWVLVPESDLGAPWKRFRVKSLLMHRAQDSGDAQRRPGERVAGDLVILQLDVPLGEERPNALIGAPAMVSTPSTATEENVTIVGWGPEFMVSAWSDTCDLTLVGRHDSRAHACDTVEGMSGSPIYRETASGQKVVVALHTRSGSERNLARLLTREELLDLQSFARGKLDIRSMRRFTRFVLLGGGKAR